MKLREAAIASVERNEPIPLVPPRPAAFAWKRDIRTTIFHVGGRGGQKQSAWDKDWAGTFGGTDEPSPANRTPDFRPAAFIPRQNPFYCALPYNDLSRGTTKPEAARVIPWFKAAFERPGQSVCQNRWIAIRNPRNGRVAYAQWSDCGPYGGTQAGYVFGLDRPKPARKGGAGLDVSPALRDFLGIPNTSLTDWRFVELRDIPPGPWRRYGENNPFAQAAGDGATRVSSEASAPITPDLPDVPTSSP